MNRQLAWLLALAALLVVVRARGVECSWERRCDVGRVMANGSRFDATAATCATWRYPLGTVLKLTESHNGSVVVVVVTDRTARRYSSRIDLTPVYFSKLDALPLGVCDCRVEVVTPTILNFR